MTQPPKEGAGSVEQGPNDLPWVSSVGSLPVSVSHPWPTAHEEEDSAVPSGLGTQPSLVPSSSTVVNPISWLPSWALQALLLVCPGLVPSLKGLKDSQFPELSEQHRTLICSRDLPSTAFLYFISPSRAQSGPEAAEYSG